jgi:hypothetical protein
VVLCDFLVALCATEKNNKFHEEDAKINEESLAPDLISSTPPPPCDVEKHGTADSVWD